jgi:HTH-type transcriptional regulator/antitoxin HigA
MMKPQVLKTETEYEAALAYLNGLMDAQPGTPEEEELESFALLVETYERENFPIGSPDPIEAIKFRMEQQGLSYKDLEPLIGNQDKVEGQS